MRRGWKSISVLVPLAVALSLAGCGDNSNNDNSFIGTTPTPGGGRTATPILTATPHPGATPTEIVEAPTPTEAGPTVTGPNPTPTVAGNACAAGDQIVVTESLDKTFAGTLVDLMYPGSVNIPGTGSSSDVTQRVHFVGNVGLTTVSDHRSNGSDFDDTLSLGSVSSTDNPPGEYATVTFDCVAGQAPPTVSDFTCTVTQASDSAGNVLPVADRHCTLSVVGP